MCTGKGAIVTRVFALIVAVIALALAIASMTTPWYVYVDTSTETTSLGSSTVTTIATWNWRGVTQISTITSQGQTQTVNQFLGYTTNCTDPSYVDVCGSDIYNAFKTAQGFGIVGCIAVGVFVLLAFVNTIAAARSSSTGVFRRRPGGVMMLLSVIVGAVAFLIAFSTFAGGFHNAVVNHWNDNQPTGQTSPCNYMCASFIGVNTTCRSTDPLASSQSCATVWGGSAGWGLAISVFAMGVFGLLFSLCAVTCCQVETAQYSLVGGAQPGGVTPGYAPAYGAPQPQYPPAPAPGYGAPQQPGYNYPGQSYPGQQYPPAASPYGYQQPGAYPNQM
jgi:hypothetical protein